MSTRIVRRRPLPETSLPRDLHPVLRRVYAARDVVAADELDYSLANLLPLQQLAGLPAAVKLLHTALVERWRILVVGDFDADGATSCALCLRALRLLGAAGVDYLVPNRFEYGYGLTPEIVAVAAGRHPDLVLTVDNGITCRENACRLPMPS
jgi:single-stranded-DNA-specific exonuclease